MNAKTAELQKKIEDGWKLFNGEMMWLHYRGGIYYVQSLVIDTDDGELRVLYSRMDGPDFDESAEIGISFVRPLREWFDEVDVDGKMTPRFIAVHRVERWEPLPFQQNAK